MPPLGASISHLHVTRSGFVAGNTADRELPIDLRAPLISSFLVVGGTASLPGLITRLRQSLLSSLSVPSSSSSSAAAVASSSTPSNQPPARITPEDRAAENKLWRSRSSEPYSVLYPLARKLAILNDPAPVDGGMEGEREGWNQGGKAPRWVPALTGWVGGSLAGSVLTLLRGRGC